MARELQILSGGDEVPMNGFAKKVVLNTILGLLGALHDIDPDKEIRIVLSAK
jgi:hypothetical protein